MPLPRYPVPMLTRRELIVAMLVSPAWCVAGSGRAASSQDEPASLSIDVLASRLRARSMSAAELTEVYLQRIARLNPSLNAFVTVSSDRARQDAARADARLRRDGAAAPLTGIPLAHKDLFETAGLRTTGGSRLFEHHVPARDAAVVSRLAAAGSVLLGKTNTHELGGGVTTINPFFGTTRNPRDTARIPGGSSGGSAAAVVAGLAAAATGSDTGGSVRIPAAFCGCVGFKPTFDRVSARGLLGAAPTFDHVGFLTRTVADARALFEAAMSPPRRPADRGTERRDQAASVAGLRIGVARHFFFEGLQPAVGARIDRALGVLQQAKARVADVSFPIDADTMAEVFDPLIVDEIGRRYRQDWSRRPDLFSPAFAGLFKAAIPSRAEVARARTALRGFQQAVARVFTTVDVLATPAVAVVAPPIAGPIDGALILRNTWPFNAARTPAVSIPCPGNPDDLPVGLQLVAAAGRDEALLDAAEAVSRLISD